MRGNSTWQERITMPSNNPRPVSSSPTIRARLAAGLGCAAINGVIGLMLPLGSYLVWAMLNPSRGGQDWSGLVGIFFATVGGLSGALVGLVAGLASAKLQSLPVALIGLGVIFFTIGLFWMIISPEGALFAAVTFPSCGATAIIAMLLKRR